MKLGKARDMSTAFEVGGNIRINHVLRDIGANRSSSEDQDIGIIVLVL